MISVKSINQEAIFCFVILFYFKLGWAIYWLRVVLAPWNDWFDLVEKKNVENRPQAPSDHHWLYKFSTEPV